MNIVKSFKIRITAEMEDRSKDLSIALVIPSEFIYDSNYDILTYTIRDNVLALANELENRE